MAIGCLSFGSCTAPRTTVASMSGQFPFGFGPGSGGSGGSGGFGEGAPFFRELEKLLSWQGGPINWELARQMAVQGASSESRPPDKAQQAAVRESGRLAN